MSIQTIAIIGFGEVGQALAADLIARGHADIRVFDLEAAKLAKALTATSSAAEAAHGADLVISAVTAAQTEAVAQAASSGIETGAYFLDLNSASPEAKRSASVPIEAAGGRYVEAALMSPIFPKTIASPILLGGPHAQEALSQLQALGFTGAKFCAEKLGQASATKLCRSVMIKGLEALITESLISARHYGVEAEVLSSLNNLFPHPDWEGYARYMISRTLEHGARRSEEMFEAARTVRDAGFEPLMATATAQRQAQMPAFASALETDDLYTMLDAIRAQLQETETR